jgi:hypothetical protein
MSLYMEGRGILEHTRRLNDALFDALMPAILGTVAVLAGPLFSWGFIIHHFPWEQPPTFWHWATATIISVISMVGGIYFSLPWLKAERAVRQHRKMMESETAKHGPGWASS